MKKERKKGRLLIIGGLIAAVVIVILFSKMKGGPVGFAVETMALEQKDIVVRIPASGTLEEVEKEYVHYENSGKITSVAVEVGDMVEAGQLLATVDVTESGNRISIAKLQLEMEELSIQKMEENRRSAMDAAKKSLEEAKTTVERNKVLYESGALSLVDYEKSQETLADLQEKYDQFVKGEDELNYEIQRLKKQAEVSRLSIADLEREEKKLKGEIVAPMSGMVTAVSVEKGSMVSPTNPCFVISKVDELEIKVSVSEYDISKVAIGQEVEIETDALAGTVFRGTVEKIDPVATKMNTGQSNETVVGVTIKVLDQHEMLKPGFTVKTKIVTDQRTGVVAVPFSAIRELEDGRKVVYVVEDQVAREREVEVGLESDFDVEIVKGLNPGDQIISKLNSDITDGSPITIISER